MNDFLRQNNKVRCQIPRCVLTRDFFFEIKVGIPHALVTWDAKDKLKYTHRCEIQRVEKTSIDIAIDESE